MFKKIIISLAAIIVLGIIGFCTYVNSGIELPRETSKIVAEVVASENLPELITGETGIANSGDINIWYEIMNPEDSIRGTILLVMGHSSTALLWTAIFYQTFVDAGYRVIRYDNRDIGMSSWIENWDKNHPYTLEDMAEDGIAVLDAAKIDEAHIIGVSMGGMIAQRMAISHSKRVSSLTSIMSSGYMADPEIEPIPKTFTGQFTKLGLRYLLYNTEENSSKFFIGIQEILKGSGPYQIKTKEIAQRTLYELRNRKGFNQKAINQQAMAIEASGSRLDELGTITSPTLVIHGKSDPLVSIAHSQKYAPLIPNAEVLYIDGMGHDIPDLYMAQVHNAIFEILTQ